jgi:hypothetical protein
MFGNNARLSTTAWRWILLSDLFQIHSVFQRGLAPLDNDPVAQILVAMQIVIGVR